MPPVPSIDADAPSPLPARPADRDAPSGRTSARGAALVLDADTSTDPPSAPAWRNRAGGDGPSAAHAKCSYLAPASATGSTCEAPGVGHVCV